MSPDPSPSPGSGARPVVFGEALFDRFPDGTEVLGGAPFNVAWHLQGLGARPLLVSRVGTDAAGRSILARMSGWGMARDGVQLDRERPTGHVDVAFEDGQPSFTIEPGQAWDALDADLARGDVRGGAAGLVYHGTLALRAPASRAACTALVDTARAPVFCDLNLRPPWDDADAIRLALGGARWIKLNADELARVTDRETGSAEACGAAAAALLERHGAAAVFVTRGEQGALAVEAGGARHEAHAPRVEDFVDSVGAGDGFSAVAAAGLLAGRPPPEILERAVAFAARVCTLRGATTDDVSLYDGFAGGA